MNDTATIGIIGGSGLYQMEGLTVLEERTIETPFGDPSYAYVIGEIDGVRVAFLSRHGRGHRLTPSELNYRANSSASNFSASTRPPFRQCRRIDETRTCADRHPLPVPFIDRTRHRPTFFGDGIVAHAGFATRSAPALADHE